MISYAEYLKKENDAKIRENFTTDDRFEIYIENSFMYWVVRINKTGRCKIDFFRGIAAAKEKIREIYKAVGVTEEKVRVTSAYYEPVYVNLKPKDVSGY